MEKIIVNIDWVGNFGAGSENPHAMGCIATADTLKEMKTVYADALKFHLEDEENAPKEYELVFKLTERAKSKK